MSIGTSPGGADRSARYGGPWFLAASTLPVDGGLVGQGRLVRLLVAGLRRPSRFAALILLILRTESLAVRLSDSLAGRALGAYFNDRCVGLFPRNRLCQGVLVLPSHHPDYLRGRRRQAMRTNLRKAAAAGIRCGPAHDPSLAFDDVLEIVRRRDGSVSEGRVDAWRERIALPELTLLAARDAHGHPVAYAGVVIDDAICLIRFAVACDHEARWALHDHLVRILIARGIRYLVAADGGPFGALGFASNVQHYQHLLGYELRHVTPQTTRPLSLKRRLLAAAAITLTSVALLVEATVAIAAVTPADRRGRLTHRALHERGDPGKHVALPVRLGDARATARGRPRLFARRHLRSACGQRAGVPTQCHVANWTVKKASIAIEPASTGRTISRSEAQAPSHVNSGKRKLA